jgi:hypothetical protein
MKDIIKQTEERIVVYKQLLSEINKDKVNYPPTDLFTLWYKDFIRERLNTNKIFLKTIVKEYEHSRQGLNPVCCYDF